MIYTQVTKNSFIDAFKRSSCSTLFSYDALEAIYEYLEDYSQDSGEDVELDIVAICCDWSEMTWQDVAMSYGVDLSQCIDDDERIGEVESFLFDNTQSMALPDGESFVFVQF